jgi:DNA polymerase elongation subunit (family B)
MKFASISKARDFLKTFAPAANFDVYGQQNWVNAFIHEEFPDEIEYDDSLIKTGFLDIETDSKGGHSPEGQATKEITAIGLVVGEKTYLWGMKDFEAPKGTTFFWFENEYEMLRHFVKAWEKLALDAVSGWNTTAFDLPYLVRRITNVLGWEWAKRLSPWKIIKPRMIKSYRGKEIEIFDIYGIIDLDYLLAFKKFRPPSLNPDDNKLDTVAHVVLGEKKVDYKAYGSLAGLYEQNPQLFFEYNIKDANLVQRMEKKLNILRLIYNMAYSAKINMSECFMPTKLWDSIIYGYLKDRDIIVPITKIEEEGDEGQFMGALVKEPEPKRHKWVMGFDITSLYPSIYLQANIGPDTIRETLDVSLDALLMGQSHGYEQYLKDNNLSMSASGVTFTRNFTSFMVEIVQSFFDDRQKYKKLMNAAKDDLQHAKAAKDKALIAKLESDVLKYDVFQQNKKISINALYGASGNKGFRFYDLRIAESITKFGQMIIKAAERAINGYMNKITGFDLDWVIASDTDSCIVNFDPFIQKLGLTDTDKIVDFLIKFAEEKIQKVALDAAFKEVGVMMNSYQDKLFMKQEKICDTMVIQAKKRYLYHVLANEKIKYDKPSIEITGLEGVKTTTPEFCRNKLKEYYAIVLKEDEATMRKFVQKVREEFYTLPFEEIAAPKGCKGLDKYGDRNFIYNRTKGVAVPMHVRGALLYNHHLAKHGLMEAEPIFEGEKIKYCYLKLPNPIGENVICAPRSLPPEFGLDEYIDYDTQFEKTFLGPVQTMNKVIGWRDEEITTLEGLWV